MDTYRAFLAIIISFVILLGYQYFFVGFDQPVDVAPSDQPVEQSVAQAPAAQPGQEPVAQNAAPQPIKVPEPVQYDRDPQDIKINTQLYTAVISEDGGVVKSFVLKKHTETNKKDSEGMELIKSDAASGFPLQFSWGTALGPRILFNSDAQELNLAADSKATLKLVGVAANGMVVERQYTFNNENYLIDLDIQIHNGAGSVLQGTPQLTLVNRPFTDTSANPASRFLFSGPAAYIDTALTQIKVDDLKEGAKSLQGQIDWAGYEGNYFLTAIVPLEGAGKSFTAQGGEGELALTSMVGNLDTLQPNADQQYKYHVFMGPKKLDMLKSIGYNLDRSVDFGWFDVIAKPTLWLLNFFYSYFLNYGVAIILVTILFKAIFWPITQKGMKSMKNIQKLQPKVQKLKEKYKNDPTKMNQEMMNLYKTYKVNPLGGCLPMVLQIPVFFALYKVLLQSIELRHAPFMLWINDLSAPDRLWLGFDIPYLGGLPVLTLLMGASMFLQQKLSPSTADPTQAKIMMMLPFIFTFMFLNFASGLVLYWFINNLLSILQQVLINRENRKPAAA